MANGRRTAGGQGRGWGNAINSLDRSPSALAFVLSSAPGLLLLWFCSFVSSSSAFVSQELSTLSPFIHTHVNWILGAATLRLNSGFLWSLPNPSGHPLALGLRIR